MLRSVSQNNLEMMNAVIRQQNFTDFVILDYAENLPPLIEHLYQVAPSVTRIHAFCEHRPSASFLGQLQGLEIEAHPWPVSDLRTFVNAPLSTGFEHHKPIYEGDISRLSGWQKLYAAGPFKKLQKRLATLPGFSVLNIFCIRAGMFLQALIPGLRPTYGTMTGHYGNTAVTLHFDGGPEKDHYGENPLLEKRLKKFQDLLHEIGQDCTRHSAFFIGAGARHLYIKDILDTQDANNLSHFIIFCTGLYRPRAYAVTARRAGGQFYKGSNTDIYRQTIYSDHCLSVGAGDKELWYYTSSKQS